jgi:hypothetical protein
MVAKECSFGGQPVEVRGQNLRIATRTEGVPALLIGIKEKDVWPPHNETP